MSSDTVAFIAAIFGGGGVIGGIVALLRFRGESTAVLVSASGEVVIMQKGMITELREELATERTERMQERNRYQEQISSLQRQVTECLERIKALQAQMGPAPR